MTQQGEINALPWASSSVVFDQIFSDSSVFSNGRVLQFAYHQNDDDGSPDFQMLLLRKGNREIFTHVPFFVKGPLVGVDANGKEVAVLIGNYFLAFMTDDGNITSMKKTRYLPFQDLVKLDDQTFLTDVIEQTATKKEWKLLTITLNGEMTKLPLVTGCATPLQTFQNDQTKEIKIVAGFLDGTIRILDGKSGVIKAQWTDGEGSLTLLAPIITESGFIVQRDRDLVWLDWKK